MRSIIVSNSQIRGQEPHTFYSTPRTIDFAVPSIIPGLLTQGFVVFPVLTRWFEILNPLDSMAWQAFKNPNILEIIRKDPQQQPRFFLNDERRLDNHSQLSVDFQIKERKSHLTVLEGSNAVVNSSLIPQSIREYLIHCSEFIHDVRELFSDVLPSPKLPTVLKLRIFEYHVPDPLAALGGDQRNAMRPHVDGSICTLIIAKSDRLLQFEHRGHWYDAARPDGKPFTLVIPGIAAALYGISATPHLVLESPELRTSITVFLAPALSGVRENAERQILQWNLDGDLADSGLALPNTYPGSAG